MKIELPEEFTKEFLLALKEGDTLETEGVFQGVDKTEPLCWKLTRVVPGKLYEFTTTYYGVFFGKFLASIRSKKVKLVPV